MSDSGEIECFDFDGCPVDDDSPHAQFVYKFAYEARIAALTADLDRTQAVCRRITATAEEQAARIVGLEAKYKALLDMADQYPYRGGEVALRRFVDNVKAFAPETPVERFYKFERLRNGKRMAEGGEVHAHSEAEAFENIRRLFSDCPATDRFVLRSTRLKNPQPAEQSIAHVEAQIKGDE